MILETKGYSYDDLTIVPNVISYVESRSQCNPFIKDNILPIFTAPMASVVNFENMEIFYDNGIIPILPRNISIDVRKDCMNEQHWVALSLKEFEDLFITNFKDRITNHYLICVDIANGHMISLYDKCIKAKQLANENNYELTIMTGNIANPETYDWLCRLNREHGKTIDYIRTGIGGGKGCLTASNVSIHYPQATLINECYKLKKYWENYTSYDVCPKIIADGGIRNYDHVNTALALGADYVMIGSLFAQCIESAGEKYSMTAFDKIDLGFNYYAWEANSLRINNKDEWFGYIKQLKDEKYIGKLNVKFFGMASADGQKSISGEKTKTAEGITKWLPVKYKLSGWVENMISYLRSAMSYCNCFELNEFIGKPDLIPNSIAEINAVNK